MDFFWEMLSLQETLFLLILLGVLVKKLKIIRENGRKTLSDLLIYAILPCNIVASFMGGITLPDGFVHNCILAVCISIGMLLILMVIRLVAQSDTPRLEFLPALPVDAQTSAGSRQGAVLKAPAHVVEQAGNCQHDRGRSNIIVPLQKELGVLISLSGPAEPHYCLDLIRLNTLPSQIQLSQHILGILVSRLR